MNHGKIKIIKSQRNGKLLLFEGYAYNMHKDINEITTWRCRNRKCPGRIIVSQNSHKLKNMHNHDSDFEKNEALFLKYNVVRRALKTSERSRDILNSVIRIATTPISNHLPQTRNFIDMITKTRKKKNFIIKDDEIPETI
ncbi:hypothetical protein DMUE_4599, partial [Dictyocoela muelleri]